MNKSQHRQSSTPDRQPAAQKEEGTASFADNRSKAITQGKLRKGMANNRQSQETAQLRKTMQEGPAEQAIPIQRKSNDTGLPDNLKSGIENLSGYAMDDVKVHYNSSKPAQLQAHAYAQGTDIHLGAGQEKHLPHEAWHVVQQKQGRVKPTKQSDSYRIKSKVNINDNAGLEKEADVMGEKALQRVATKPGKEIEARTSDIIQRKPDEDDFAKPGVNPGFNPNLDAGEAEGMRLIPQADKRPDDVPEVPEYRRAVNKMHNILMAVKSKVTPAKYTVTLNFFLDLQAEGKRFAKLYKQDARDLQKDDEAMFQPRYEQYLLMMEDLTAQVNEYAAAVMRANNITESQLGLQDRHWRTRWLQILSIVQSVLAARWPYWKKAMKQAMKGLYGWEDNQNPNPQRQLAWHNSIDTQTWKLFFGGSLAKGYKGPPKQNVRFQSEKFDIDANMDAPAVAEYLINVKGKKVDREQLGIDTVNDTELLIPQMDHDIDGHIKYQLAQKGVGTAAEIDQIISEPFETRVNAKVANPSAQQEVDRGIREQALRDRITEIAKTSKVEMEFIRDLLILNGNNYLMDIDGRLVLADRPLDLQEIIWINGIIDFVEGGGM